MHVDLTQAAKADHLNHVPAIAYDLNPQYGPAGYLVTDDTMHLGSAMHAYHPDAYDQARFKRAGITHPLDNSDAERFILAHELWHARQWEMNYSRTAREAQAIMTGHMDHDTAPIEVEADQHAAKTYKLIGLS